MDNEPTLANGKICYIEIPATDINTSSKFYKEAFGWQLRQRNDGHIAFDDTVGQVSGTWVTNRKPITETGILIYVMVYNIVNTMELILSNGGKIVQQVGADAPEITARFSDPAGNI